MASEFGKGCAYCLGLFLCHAERPQLFSEKLKETMNEAHKKVRTKKEWDDHEAEIWFNGSSDHLYELQVPENIPASTQKRLRRLQKKAIHWGHGFQNDCNGEDKVWAIEEAKNLLRLLDHNHGIKTLKGQWE